MKKYFMYFIFTVVFIAIAFLLIHLRYSEMLSLGVILIGGATIIFLENIPSIKDVLTAHGIMDILNTRRYILLAFLNGMVLVLSENFSYPKLCYLIGIIFAASSLIFFVTEHKRNKAGRKLLIFSGALTIWFLILNFYYYSKYAQGRFSP